MRIDTIVSFVADHLSDSGSHEEALGSAAAARRDTLESKRRFSRTDGGGIFSSVNATELR